MEGICGYLLRKGQEVSTGVLRRRGQWRGEQQALELGWYSNGPATGMWFPERLPLFLAEDVRANKSWKPSYASLDMFCLCLPAQLKEKWLPHRCPIPRQLFGNLPFTSTLQLACTLSADHFLSLSPSAPNGSICRIYEVSDVPSRTEHRWKPLESWWKLLESSIIYPLEKHAMASGRAPLLASEPLLNLVLAQRPSGACPTSAWPLSAPLSVPHPLAVGLARIRKERVNLPHWHVHFCSGSDQSTNFSPVYPLGTTRSLGPADTPRSHWFQGLGEVRSLFWCTSHLEKCCKTWSRC